MFIMKAEIIMACGFLFVFRATAIYGTPAMFIDLLNHQKFALTNFSSIRTGMKYLFKCIRMNNEDYIIFSAVPCKLK